MPLLRRMPCRLHVQQWATMAAMKVALTVNDFLRRADEVYPNRIAVIDEPDQPAVSWGSFTYAEMAARARAQALWARSPSASR